ncbi:bacteriophytochrome (light-regulated signal transduction histidine kinase) [Leptolyngbya sp. PCC 7375]|nr:bacteriophytochrome (light-regulated signal transduction histidine kinase) [Leptolyngbya sp. PCC 7375]
MQYNQQTEPLINRAFQSLLNHRRVTCLLVNRQNYLLHVCGDPLGLLNHQSDAQTDGSSRQDILKCLPISLRQPVSIALQQAHINAGHIQRASGQISTVDDERPYRVTIEAHLHMASASTEEFLTLLVERETYDASLEKLGQCASTDLSVHSLTQSHNPKNETTELLAINKRLRAEVLERQQTEQKLAQKAEALIRSNADLEEFAYVVSHDLQEPLRAMTAFSQLLAQRYKDSLDASAQRYITHIVDGGIRMKAMIDGILELSRINSKQLNNNPTDLEQALATALENLKLIRLENQATITHGGLPTLDVDTNHVVQLLQNLISNAIKFRGPEPPHIHISAEQQATKWFFSVQDNGIGIPQDQQKRIFKLFQRLHNQQEQKGYGIGLAICKKIVEHYQGNIWLKSSPGEGSIFYFTLVPDKYQHEA